MSTFEDRVMQAIVDQFFNPIQKVDQNGYTVYQETPAAAVARTLLNNQKDDIIKQVIDKIDINDLAVKITAAMYAEITKPSTTYSRNVPRENLDKLVQEKLAAKIANDLYAGRKDGPQDAE